MCLSELLQISFAFPMEISGNESQRPEAAGSHLSRRARYVSNADNLVITLTISAAPKLRRKKSEQKLRRMLERHGQKRIPSRFYFCATISWSVATRGRGCHD